MFYHPYNTNSVDEVLKDADVVHHCMNGLSKAVMKKERARFDKLCAEFGLGGNYK